MSNEAKDDKELPQGEQTEIKEEQEVHSLKDEYIAKKIGNASHGKVSVTARIPAEYAPTILAHYYDNNNVENGNASEGVFFAELIKQAVFDANNPTKQAVEVREVEVVKEVQVPVEVLVEPTKTWVDYLSWALVFILSVAIGYLFYRLKKK
jgi:hypothetical protein